MTSNTSDTAPRFDPNFTQNVINATGPKTNPRMREVMTGLITHLHDWARDVELTVDEWMEGVQMINWAGKMSDNKRNEGQLLCDVIGLESSVITHYEAVELEALILTAWWMRLPTRKPRRRATWQHRVLS